MTELNHLEPFDIDEAFSLADAARLMSWRLDHNRAVAPKSDKRIARTIRASLPRQPTTARGAKMAQSRAARRNRDGDGKGKGKGNSGKPATMDELVAVSNRELTERNEYRTRFWRDMQ